MCKGIITNMLNRIIVMMDEELLFCDGERYLVLRNLIEKFDEDRKNGIKYLINICKCLVDGKISRHASDIRAFWDYRIRFGGVKINEGFGKNDDDYFKNFIKCFEKNEDKMYYWLFKIFNNKNKISKGGFRKKKEYIYKIWEVLFILNKKKYDSLMKKIFEYKFDEFDKNKKEGRDLCF